MIHRNAPEDMLAQVEFREGWSIDRLHIVADLGFFVVDAEDDKVRVVGFHADEQDREAIVPALNLYERNPADRALKRNAKGMGIMLGNSPQSIDKTYAELGLPERTIGLWATPAYRWSGPSVDPLADIQKLNDPRPMSPLVMARGIKQHMHYIDLARRTNVDNAIREIEAPYGQANLAIINPAPTWLWKQMRRGITYPLVPPLWGLYRDQAYQPLERIGTYVADEQE